MKIGLIDVDSFNPKVKKQGFPNLALMKLSAWHKLKGDHVEMYDLIDPSQYDTIYASQVFTWNKIPFEFPREKVLFGGSGIDLKGNLPNEIEHIYPDYGLYGIDYAMGYLTRGCLNACPFCLVHAKEGKLHLHSPLEEFWKDQTHVKLLDNDLTDCPEALDQLQLIRDKHIRLDLSQGFNVRTIKKAWAEVLREIKVWEGGHWHIAWDNRKDEQKVMQGIQILFDAGFEAKDLMVLCLIGFSGNFADDLYRIETLKAMGIRSYAMIYKDFRSNAHSFDTIYHHLEHWTNFKRFFFEIDFETYLHKQNYSDSKPQNEALGDY